MWSLDEIAIAIGGKVIGDASYKVSGIATLQTAKAEHLSFLANTKYSKFLVDTHAGAVIVKEQAVELVPNHAIVTDDPYVAYAKAATLMNPPDDLVPSIDKSAVIAPDCRIAETATVAANAVIEHGVTIGDNVFIGPGCVIARGCSIGDGSRLIANVTLCRGVELGQRAVIHPGVVIGADGFGIANDNGRWIKIPQIGSVKIGDDVEVGANTTIDRGAIEDTTIANGVKLDNQIQIGHNCIIGENTVIAGCVGIAGSTIIGKNCAIGGGAGLGGHLELVDGVQVTGMTMVTKSIKEPGVYSSGIPAEPTQVWHRNVVHYRQLTKMNERLKNIEKTIKK